MERFRLMQQPFESLMYDLMAVDAFPGAPVCIISDPWLAWVQESADKLHIPRYAFYPSQATVLATLFYLPVLQAQGRLPLKASPAPDNVEECDEELVVRVPNLPPLRNLDCVSVLLETFPNHIRDAYVGAWLTIPKAAAGVLVNTFYELDTVPFDALQDPSLNPNKIPVFAIGPLHAHSNLAHPTSETAESSNFVNQVEKKCLQWLDSQSASSVLYISFGSLFLPSLAQIHELALGIEASEQFFVWVLRPPPGTLCSTEKIDVSTILPEGFLSRTKERGFIIPNWAPQRLILSHPSTGAFLTHCGWNSTLESICMGVPMVAVPQFADQRLNRMLIVNQLKVGVEPRRSADGLVERGEVERVTRLVLTGKEGMELRSRAKQWSAAAMKAVEKGGSSDRNLESFISKMEQLSSKNL
ncbi:hypothetical protein O6H91_21G008700 [Diphasiastrum complanatum]|nr:hypothetical protein O6H91_21G008700 [Diphasiastrum complanatum]